MANTIGPNNNNSFTGLGKLKGKKAKQQAQQIEDGNEKVKKPKASKKAIVLGAATALALLGVGVKAAKGKPVADTEKVLTRAQEHIKDFTQVANEVTERSGEFADSAKITLESVQKKVGEVTQLFFENMTPDKATKEFTGPDGAKVVIEMLEDKSHAMTEFAQDGKTILRKSLFSADKDLPTSIIETIGDSKNTYSFKKAGVLSNYTEGERMMGQEHYKHIEMRLNPDGKTLQIYKQGVKEGPSGVVTDKVVEFGEKERLLQYVEDRTDMIKDGTIVSQNALEVAFTPKGKVQQVTSDHAINIEAGRQPGFGFKEQMQFNSAGTAVSYQGPNEAGEIETYVHKQGGQWHIKK